MGTNYYLHRKEPCPHCGHADEPLHIGKSSAGWAFALQMLPGEGLNCLDDWIEAWSEPGSYILNEYGERVSPEVMLVRITKRNEVLKRAMPPHGLPIPFTTYDHVWGDFS